MPHKNLGAAMGTAFLAILGVTARDWNLDATGVVAAAPVPTEAELHDMPVWLWVTGTTIELGGTSGRFAWNDDSIDGDAALLADAAQRMLGADADAHAPSHAELPAIPDADVSMFIRLAGVPDTDAA